MKSKETANQTTEDALVDLYMEIKAKKNESVNFIINYRRKKKKYF